MKNNIALIIKEQAEKYKTRTALRYRDKDFTFKDISWIDFYQSIQKINYFLLKLNLTEKSNIGILSNNRPEWTIADIAILAGGNIVVPFFSNSSRQQLQYIIDETKMELLFVGNAEQFDLAISLRETCESLKYVVVFDDVDVNGHSECFLFDCQEKMSNHVDRERIFLSQLNQVGLSDIATIIYTSGTTGEPKGVMLSHSNFMQCFKIHDQRLMIDENDTSLCFLPLSHVFERSWTFYMLFRGAVNVYLDNPKDVMDVLPVVKPTVMCTVPRFLEKVYEGIILEKQKWTKIKQHIFEWSVQVGQTCNDYRSRGEKIPYRFEYQRKVAEKFVFKRLKALFGGNIRFIPCSGAAASTDLLKFYHSIEIFICYGYGATETTATVSCYPFNSFAFDTCGRVMPEVEVKIGDKNEIMIKGETIFSGYYNKPKETAKVLVDGWYMTGDSGFLLDGDVLVMKDRIRDIFKSSGGKYISPQKVELQVSRDPIVDQVISIGDNRKYVTALIVPSVSGLKKLAKAIGKHHLNHEELVKDDLIIEHLRHRFEKIQKDLNPHERVVKFVLLSKPFSIENKTLTSTLKIRRRIVLDHFRNEIEDMY